MLEELAPGIRIIAVLLNPGYPFTAVALPELRNAADARGLRLEICEVRTFDQLPTSLDAAVKAGATGLTILETPTLLGFAGKLSISQQSFGCPRFTQIGILLAPVDCCRMERIVGSCPAARRRSSTKF